MSRSTRFSTFIFLDTETTGLPINNFKPRITELTLLAVNRADLVDIKTTPRVVNKLSMLFNPHSKFQPVAEKLSGLSPANLLNEMEFDDLAVNQICNFLRRLRPPVCLVAQNGFKFDYPLLNVEVHRAKGSLNQFVDRYNNPIYCADSRNLFRHFEKDLDHSNGSTYNPNSGVIISDSSQSPSLKIQTSSPFSLGTVHERIFGVPHDGAHTAEGDCLALMKIVQFLGEKALSWFDSNNREISTFKMMYEIEDEVKASLSTDQVPLENQAH